MIREFRDFIAKGNVMDLAVGIIVGAAFTAIVNSLVADIINPILGLLIGGVDFSNLYYVMSGSVPKARACRRPRTRARPSSPMARSSRPSSSS